MRVLNATETQYIKLNRYINGSNKLEFIKDAKNRWIVSPFVLKDDAFLSIREDLNKLTLINYEPIKVND